MKLPNISTFWQRILLMMLIVTVLNLLTIPLGIAGHNPWSTLFSAFVIGPIGAWTSMWLIPGPKRTLCRPNDAGLRITIVDSDGIHKP